MLHNTPIELLVLLFTLPELCNVLENNFLLLSKNLLNNLVLVLAHFVQCIARLNSQLLVLVAYSMNSPDVVSRECISLLFPCITNFLQMVLLFTMDLPKLLAAAVACIVVCSQFVFELLDMLYLLFVLSFKFHNLALQF